jgi:hypothetical protein
MVAIGTGDLTNGQSFVLGSEKSVKTMEMWKSLHTCQVNEQIVPDPHHLTNGFTIEN